MKIAILEPHLGIYGGIRRILELSHRLTMKGHDVTIYHSDGSPCHWKKCAAKVLPANDILKTSHDILLFNDPAPKDYYLSVKTVAKLKIYYVLALYELDLLSVWHPKLYHYKSKYRRSLFLRRIFRHPYLILSNATWMQQWLTDNLDLENTLLIGGIDATVFHPLKKNAKHTDEFRILHVGDPRERKGKLDVERALDIVRKKFPDIVVNTFYGKGHSQSKLAEIYGSTDIFVDGQWQAGWNNPVAEAMACQCPIVCSDIGGVKDFAFHEKTAILVPPRNPNEMATAIIQLIQNPQLRKKIAYQAYQHITRFKWDNSADELERILKEQIRQKSSRPYSLRNRLANFFDEIIVKVLYTIYDLGRFIRRGLTTRGSHYS